MRWLKAIKLKGNDQADQQLHKQYRVSWWGGKRNQQKDFIASSSQKSRCKDIDEYDIYIDYFSDMMIM